jgi:hypothetical protein
MLDIRELLIDEIEFGAEWRYGKANEFPDDAERNRNAGMTLEQIAADLKTLDGSQLHWRLQTLCTLDPDRYCETLSALIRAIGFRSSSKTGAEFVAELLFLAHSWESTKSAEILPINPEAC